MESNILDDMVWERIRTEKLPAGFDIRFYRPDDEKYIEPVEQTLRDHPDYGREWEKMLNNSLTLTVIYEDVPIGTGGVIPFADNTEKAVVWMIVSRKIKKLKKSSWRVVRSALSIVEDVFGFPEIWAYARADSVVSCRVLEHLGFYRKEINTINRVSYRFYRKEKNG